MNKKILILGASGNFGSKIAKLLAKENIEIILAGRQKNSLIDLKKVILNVYPRSLIDIACFDIHDDIIRNLNLIKED